MMLLTLLGWTLFGGVAAVPAWRMLRGLIEWEGGGGKLTIGSPTSIALIATGLGVAAFRGGLIGLVGGGGGVTAPIPAPVVFDAPATPTVTSAQPLDTSTVQVVVTDFGGDQSDTYDSLRIMLDSAGKDFTSPLIDSIVGPVTQDTLEGNAVLTATATYDVVALQKGASGGWSDTSAVFQFVNSTNPGTINDLSVVAQSDSSLTLQWTTVHNGAGGKANHAIRRSDTDPFNWGGTEEFNSEVFDSAGSSIGEVVTREMTGLSASTSYEFGIKAYAGEPNTASVSYGATSNIASGTTTGSGQDTTDTPTLTLGATSDTNSVQMTGSGFSGGSQTHDSTRWRLDDNSDMSSPFHDVTSASDLTSHTVTDNANLDADATYYGTVQYFGSLDASAVSEIVSVVNTAPSEGHPNEPAGMTQHTDQPHDSLGSLGWNVSNTNGFSITTDATAPISPSNVAQHEIEAGASAAIRGQTGAPFLGEKEVYVHFAFKLSSNWQGHSSGTSPKVFNLKPGSNGNHILRVRGIDAGQLNMAFTAQVASPFTTTAITCDSNNDLGNTCGGAAKITRGQWHEVEVHAAVGTQNTADGEVHVWRDGQKALEAVGVKLLGDGGTTQWTEIIQLMLWGGTGDTVDNTMQMWVDNVYISGKS